MNTYVRNHEIKLWAFFINQAAFAGAEMNILPNFGAPKKLHFKEKRHGKIVLKFWTQAHG